LLAEQILYNTYIPRYILKAIAFTSSHINLSSKVKAILYRLTSMRNNANEELQDEAKKFKIRGKSDEEILKAFCDTFKEDQLTKLLALI